jgi:hypothetical protein
LGNIASEENILFPELFGMEKRLPTASKKNLETSSENGINPIPIHLPERREISLMPQDSRRPKSATGSRIVDREIEQLKPREKDQKESRAPRT